MFTEHARQALLYCLREYQLFVGASLNCVQWT